MADHANDIRNAIGNPAALQKALSALAPLTDRQIQRIAKSLWKRSSKNRAEALQNISNYINREHLALASQRALDRTPL